MDDKARGTSSSPGWLEALLLVLFTFLALLLSAARSPGATLAVTLDPAPPVRGLESLGAPTVLGRARAVALLLATAHRDSGLTCLASPQTESLR